MIWPVTRSTVSHGPGCQTQRAAPSVRQRIVDAQCASNGEGTVGDVVDLAGRPLFLPVIDVEGADSERRGLVGFGVGRSVGLRVRNAA